MLIKAGWYYNPYISTSERDLPPAGYSLFVISAGHTKAITKNCIETVYTSRRDYQLLYVQHGVLHCINKDGTKYTVPEGSFVLFRPLEYQHYYLNLKDDTDVYWCHFAGPFAEALLKDCNIFDKRVITLTPQVEYRRIYTRMRKALENRPKYFIQLCALYLKELLTTVASAIESENDSENIPESLKKILLYID